MICSLRQVRLPTWILEHVKFYEGDGELREHTITQTCSSAQHRDSSLFEQ